MLRCAKRCAFISIIEIAEQWGIVEDEKSVAQESLKHCIPWGLFVEVFDLLNLEDSTEELFDDVLIEMAIMLRIPWNVIARHGDDETSIRMEDVCDRFDESACIGWWYVLDDFDECCNVERVV